MDVGDGGSALSHTRLVGPREVTVLPGEVAVPLANHTTDHEQLYMQETTANDYLMHHYKVRVPGQLLRQYSVSRLARCKRES
jgi:hypothetical protein